MKDGIPHLLVSHLGMSGAWFYVRNLHEIERGKIYTAFTCHFIWRKVTCLYMRILDDLANFAY